MIRLTEDLTVLFLGETEAKGDSCVWHKQTNELTLNQKYPRLLESDDWSYHGFDDDLIGFFKSTIRLCKTQFHRYSISKSSFDDDSQEKKILKIKAS